MAVDPNIFQAFAQPVRSVTDIQNSLNQSDLAQSQIQQSRIGVRNALALQSQKDQLRQAVQSGQIDLTNPAHASRALSIAPDVAPALLETVQKGQTSRALMGKDNAQAAHFTAQTTSADLDNKAKAASQLAARVQTLQSPDDIASFYEQGVKDGLLTTDQAVSAIDQVPYKDPAAFAKWKQDQFQASVPVVEKYRQDAETARGAATNRTHIQGIGIQQAGENTRAAAARQTQLTINGMDAQGNFVGLGGAAPAAPAAPPQGPPTAAGAPPAAVGTPQPAPQAGGLGALVDALGNGKISPETAFARVPPGVKSQVLAMVQQKFPDYDPTAYATTKKGELDFATGRAGNTVRSFNVGLAHLDTLGQLADALHNNDVQAVNKIGNFFSQQTGAPAVTNFQAAKKVVGDEIVKAITGAGGGVEDRKEAAATLSAANSPEQLKGVIDTYKQLMVGQLGGLEGQYKASTGKGDFQTKYLSPEARAVFAGRAAAAHPPEIVDLLNKYGPK